MDIDNTLWDLIRPWIRTYNYIYNDDIIYDDITMYEFFKITSKATKEDMLNILNTEPFWDLVQPYKHSYEYLNKLNKEFDVYIITSTSYKTTHKKFDMFFKYFDFIDEHQLVITSRKQMVNVDVMIDDCPKSLEYGSYHKLLIDAPYNRQEQGDGIIRVKDMKEAYEIIHTLNF